MSKKAVRTISLALLVLSLLIAFLYLDNDIGVRRSMVERDARSSQKISDDWLAEKDVSDTMAALIFYPEDQSDHTYPIFSIYVNRPGLSIGYFFRAGGTVVGTERYVAEFIVEGYHESAFISTNEQRVERLEIDDGDSVQVIEIDSSKPFAMVVPSNAGITFYDIGGNVVETYKNPLW